MKAATYGGLNRGYRQRYISFFPRINRSLLFGYMKRNARDSNFNLDPLLHTACVTPELIQAPLDSRSATPTPLKLEPHHFPWLVGRWLPIAKSTHDQSEPEEPLEWVYNSCIHHKMRERQRVSRLSEPFYIADPGPLIPIYLHLIFSIFAVHRLNGDPKNTWTSSQTAAAQRLPPKIRTWCSSHDIWM